MGRLTPGYLVAVAYIFSPFDSKEEVMGKLDEMVEFAEKAPDNVGAVFVPSVLEAWPGTPIRQEHIDELFLPGDYMGPLAYSWNPIMFPKHTLFFEAVQKVPGVGNVPIESLLGLRDKTNEIFG